MLSLFTLTSALAVAPISAAGVAPPDAIPTSTRLNHIQVIGSHNSYKKLIEPALFKLMLMADKAVEALDYGHISLTDQLNLGLLNLEIDVHNDPKGGLYADPLGNRLLKASGTEPTPYDVNGELKQPGFKVIHDADFDFRSCHVTFAGVLDEFRAWSDAHPGHEPIIVTMNCKDEVSRIAGAVKPAKFDAAAFDELDKLVREKLGDGKLITPDFVRKDSPTLESAVLTNGWPTLKACQGKFLFVLDEDDEKMTTYIAGHPSLKGRVYFTLSQPVTPEAAFFIINDPVKDESKIRELVTKGYMVRTRADSETREARAGFTAGSGPTPNTTPRFEAAKRSGAQVITTDYYIPDLRLNHTYQIRFEDGAFRRRNPVVGTQK